MTRLPARPFRSSAYLAAALTAAQLLVATPARAQESELPSGAYRMDRNHSQIFWSVRHMGLSDYTGRIESFDIELTLDMENLENSVVRATIDPSSVSTGYQGQEDFDAQIANEPRLLNAGAHPEITFVSTSVEQTGEESARVTGDLTLLGVTKEVMLDVELVGALPQHPFTKKAAVGFKAVARFDRTEFGMDFLAPLVVAPEATVRISAEFTAE